MILFNKDMDYYISVFNKNKCLYLEDSFNKIKKISRNVYLYSALIDSLNQVHICILTNNNSIYYYTYYNDNLSLIFSSKLNINTQKIYKLSLYLLKNSINIFFCQYSGKLSNDIFHLNYDFYTFNLIDFKIDTSFKNKLYYINKSNNSLICSYYTKSHNKLILNSVLFDDDKKFWSKFSNTDTTNVLFDYCNKIKY